MKRLRRRRAIARVADFAPSTDGAGRPSLAELRVRFPHLLTAEQAESAHGHASINEEIRAQDRAKSGAR
jgi:hypothetical protein